MSITFSYTRNDAWPRLAWVAELRPGDGEVIVRCGSHVEATESWFCEAVWDGDFADGDFDLTDIVAGTGARIRDGKVTFVSSASLQDRLQYLQCDDKVLVSNSLSAIVALSGVDVDPTNHSYPKIFGTIGLGLGNYDDLLPTTNGDIRFVYYENLCWDGHEIGVQPKPRRDRDFSSYDRYVAFLQAAVRRVVGNAVDGARASPFTPYASLSSGYDSPTVAVLAADAGVTQAITLGADRDGADDSGEKIGELLGYDVTVYERAAWRRLDMPEVDCIAACGNAAEVSFAAMAEQLRGGVLLSGFWGGKAWRRNQDELRPIYVGNDGAGMCFTEMRLGIGFINCAVPYWGGMQVADIVRISQSPEMSEWSVSGDYDRPICRRMLESAGIPREWFGQRKQGVSEHVLGAERFMSDKSAGDYESWIRQHSGAWLRKWRFPPSPVLGRLLDRVLVSAVAPFGRRVLVPGMRRMAGVPGFGFVDPWVRATRRKLLRMTTEPLHYRRYTYPWALARSKQKYLGPGSVEIASGAR